MTFNDCDRDKAVKLVEQHYACYTPGTLVQQFAVTVGYNQIFSWNNNGATTWLELRKPGALTSLRGGQTVAKIKVNPKYAELDFLRKLALEFNLVNIDSVNTQSADQLKEIIIKSGRENLLKSVAESK
jgi:hypothetical protein